MNIYQYNICVYPPDDYLLHQVCLIQAEHYHIQTYIKIYKYAVYGSDRNTWSSMNYKIDGAMGAPDHIYH